jgi:hypothetical protein
MSSKEMLDKCKLCVPKAGQCASCTECIKFRKGKGEIV